MARKISGGEEIIMLYYQSGYDLARDKAAVNIQPLYLKRFDVLHKWFEKFSVKTIRDQRDGYSVGFDGRMLDKRNEFFFLMDEENFDTDFADFKQELIGNSEFVFKRFSSVPDIYQYIIRPILENKNRFSDTGADWIFQYLAVSKIVKPELFDEVKSRLEKQVEFMMGRREPNVANYYARFHEIVAYLKLAVL